jgi:hypothetical protein
VYNMANDTCYTGMSTVSGPGMRKDIRKVEPDPLTVDLAV